MTKIIGFAASLRNARSLEGGKELVKEISSIKSYEDLLGYLETQGNLHLESFYKAGREKGVSFDRLFRELKKSKGLGGLSNSEICLTAALWGAITVGAEVELLPLPHFFPEGEKTADEELLRKTIIAADGFIVASPVYFGDRSSLSQRFIDFLRLDSLLKDQLHGKIYGGVTVGAKRNGGQETSLIYQMHDIMELGALGVGNDYITTSQYGGTGHAGDIGTMPKDEYGIKTCVGTGRRVARVASMHATGRRYQLQGPLKVGVLILQDKDRLLQRYLKKICNEVESLADFEFVELAEKKIMPCMACDICPCRIGEDQDYRCVRGKHDDMHLFHNKFLSFDVIVPAMLSPVDRHGLHSTYQQFLERTRYIRRGDYALSDRLVAPLVVSEVGASENLNIRMITSLIRHHTVMHKPIMGWYQNDTLLNAADLVAGLESTVDKGVDLTIGRLVSEANDENLVVYKPVGYVLSSCRDEADDALRRRSEAIAMRLQSRKREYSQRIRRIAERN